MYISYCVLPSAYPSWYPYRFRRFSTFAAALTQHCLLRIAYCVLVLGCVRNRSNTQFTQMLTGPGKYAAPRLGFGAFWGTARHGPRRQMTSLPLSPGLSHLGLTGTASLAEEIDSGCAPAEPGLRARDRRGSRRRPRPCGNCLAACGGRHSGDAGPGPTDSKWWSLTVPPFPPTNGYKGDTSPG